YTSLSIKEKTIINLTLAMTVVVFIIGSLYNFGEVVGEFLYYSTH
ncbi:MAG: hypothetical protein ACJAQX_001938, partial [Polaribacter sp.]